MYARIMCLFIDKKILYFYLLVKNVY
jgi:hypothetical protein